MGAPRSPETRRSSSSRRRPRVTIVLVVVFASLLGLAWCALRLPDPLSEKALRGHRLVDRQVVAETRLPNGEVRREFELRCSCGQVVRLAARYPATGAPHPLVLMLGGRKTGRRAVDLVPSLHGWTVAALDYPDPGPLEHNLWSELESIPRIRRALRHVVPSLRLALDALLMDGSVEPRHVELVGVSLGSIFVIPEAVRDERVRRLWLMDGAGDLRRLLNYALASEIPSPILRGLGARLIYELAYGPRFEPQRWLGRFAPREVVLVNAREDRRLPMRSVLALQQAAREPKRIIWLEGGHVRPSRVEELRALAEVFFAGQAPVGRDENEVSQP